MEIGIAAMEKERKQKMDDLISRQVVLKDLEEYMVKPENAISVHPDDVHNYNSGLLTAIQVVTDTPSVQPERLTDDDFETIRIHLNAQKEELCNQHRWKEAEKYQRIIDRFMAFASAQSERKKGKWIITDIDIINRVWHCNCSECGEDPLHFISGTEDWWLNKLPNYCPNCGADMREEKTDVGSKM